MTIDYGGKDPNLNPLVETILQGFINGLILRNDTDTDHDIEISTGQCADADASLFMSLTSVITKQIDVNWVEGDDAGGFPSGLTLTADTWYRVFIINKNGTLDAGYDTSSTATNLLSDASTYSEYKQVGWVLTDVSSNIEQFRQHDDDFIWDVPPKSWDGTNPGTSGVLRTIAVPPSTDVQAIVEIKPWITQNAGFTAHYVLYTSPSQTDTDPTSSIMTVKATEGTNSGDRHSVPMRVVIEPNTSSQIRERWTTSTTDVHSVGFTIGWRDKRRV